MRGEENEEHTLFLHEGRKKYSATENNRFDAQLHVVRTGAVR